MKVPKHYFHDRSVLALVSVNAALSLLTVIYVLLGVNTDESATSIVAYRGTAKVGSISGPTSDLYQFALFVAVVTVATTLLSMKLYAHRRHLSIGALGLNILLLVMTFIIFNALTRTL